MNTHAVTYEFGPFRLSVVDRQLFQGDAPIPLTPKVFETLVVLVEEAGRLVQKDEFLSRIWPDTVVEEVGLAHNISQLRRVLGDARDEPQFIQTVPKRGYRFVAPVTIVPPASPELRTRVVVGVLPFDNLTGDAEREYLADGLMEELIVSLGQIDSARIAVLGRTSMMRQKGRTGPIADIGRQLNATHLIEGSHTHRRRPDPRHGEIASGRRSSGRMVGVVRRRTGQRARVSARAECGDRRSNTHPVHP